MSVLPDHLVYYNGIALENNRILRHSRGSILSFQSEAVPHLDICSIKYSPYKTL